MMRVEESEVLTIEECAEMLKVSPRTLYKLVSEEPQPDKIPARKVGRAWRIWRGEVERFLRHELPSRLTGGVSPPKRAVRSER